MGSMGKVIAGLIAGAVIIAVLLVTMVASNLDDIIRKAIETSGTEVMQTRVSLDAAVFTLKDGRGELHGLSVANPPGYTSKYALQMQQIALQVDPGSITGDVIVIKEVLVDGAQLVAEQKALATNLQGLLENIEANSGAETSPPPAPEGEPVHLMIEKFSFINSSANVITEQWGEKALPITDIVITDIGDKQTGLTPDQLAHTISQTLMRRAQSAVKDYLEQLARDAAMEELDKQLDDKLDDDQKKTLNGLKSMFDK